MASLNGGSSRRDSSARGPTDRARRRSSKEQPRAGQLTKSSRSASLSSLNGGTYDSHNQIGTFDSHRQHRNRHWFRDIWTGWGEREPCVIYQFLNNLNSYLPFCLYLYSWKCPKLQKRNARRLGCDKSSKKLARQPTLVMSLLLTVVCDCKISPRTWSFGRMRDWDSLGGA